MRDLSGKVALVTGSSKGIGAGIAERLAGDGASVIVNYSRSSADAEAVVNRIRKVGGIAFPVRADIANPSEIPLLIAATLEQFGRLDILVNNAGVYKADTLDSITPETVDFHYRVNVRGLLLTTQAAARVIPEGGVVINVSSGLSKSPYPMLHVYCSSKGAVDTLTRSLALELGSRKIRVVGIAPGFTSTDGNAETPAEMSDAMILKTPLGRVGLPADIASAISFAVSRDADWITGSTIDVAGGMIF